MIPIEKKKKKRIKNEGKIENTQFATVQYAIQIKLHWFTNYRKLSSPTI